jgi:hypothetical protein
VADELYRSARRLRIFVSSPPTRSLEPVVALLTWPAEQVEARVAAAASLI